MAILFEQVTAVTMDPTQPILHNAYVAVEGNSISYVGTQPPQGTFTRTISGAGKVLMPGLVNAHTHLPMTLMRGYGGGCDLQHWLNDYIFPAEDKLDSRSVKAGTMLALAELIASGTTCVADMYYFCDDIAQCVDTAGINANLHPCLVCCQQQDPTQMESWKEMEALYEKWNGYDHGRILVDASVHAEYTSFACPALWETLGNWAVNHHCNMQVHISETQSEHEDCIHRHGKTPIALFDQYGLWQTGGVAAHCVYVSEEDMDLMAQRGITAVHNPMSNLKLASGIARVPSLLKHGVNVALGTDGVASNNSHDMFEEIKLAATLHKGVTRDPMAVSAHEALSMATVNGAAALKRNTGMIAEGKQADLILVDFTAPALTPCHDVEENLAFSSNGSHVQLTMAMGQILYENGQFLTIDLEQVQHKLKDYALPRIFQQ